MSAALSSAELDNLKNRDDLALIIDSKDERGYTLLFCRSWLGTEDSVAQAVGCIAREGREQEQYPELYVVNADREAWMVVINYATGYYEHTDQHYRARQNGHA